MNEYVLSVVGTVIITSFLTAILPNGKTANTVKAMAKTVCLITIITPLASFLTRGDLKGENSLGIFHESGIQTNVEFINYYSELSVGNAQTALEKEIEEKFGVQTMIVLDWENQMQKDGYYRVKINKITVRFLLETPEERKETVQSYLKKTYCSEVLVE